MNSIIKKVQISDFFWLLIPIIYIINLLAKDIQEDSWITFRTAFNIADHGQWSYNLGDAYSSTTSFAYPILVAIIRSLFGSWTVQVVLILNSIVVLIAIYNLIQILNKIWFVSVKLQKIIFVLLSIQPISLLLAGKGMETIYLLLIILISIRFLQADHYRKTIFCASLAIFIRPDAIVYTIVLGLYLLKKNNRIRFFYIYSNFFTLVVYLILNKILTQDWLPATISAKRTSYGESLLFKFSHFMIRPQIETFAPLTTKFIPDLIYRIFFILAILFILFLFLKSSLFNLVKDASIYLLLFMSVFPIFVYGLTTSVFPWYTWPSRFLFQSILIYFLIAHISMLKLKIVFILFVIVSSFIQLAISVNTGIRYEYRISIGIYLQENSTESDMLILEPAGQIPFYSGLKTIDTVGLTNPAAIEYQDKFGDSYLEHMLIDLKPRWVLLPAPINKIMPSVGEYPELADYALIKQFKYNPEDFSNGFVLMVAKFGTLNDDLYLYMLN
jgi:hypothetical protein